MTTPLTTQQLDDYATAAVLADHQNTTMDPAIVTTLVDEVRRLQQQRRYLIGQVTRKGAASGDADRKLEEFLTDDSADEATAAPTADAGDARTSASHEATVAVTVTAPTAENAGQWAETIADLVLAEHGQHMRLDVSINPPTLPRNGGWRVTRGGVTVHTAATRAEAEAVGTFAIRQETRDLKAQVVWVCPVCYGEDVPCQGCSDDNVWYLDAVGVLTDAQYAVERTPSTRA